MKNSLKLTFKTTKDKNVSITIPDVLLSIESKVPALMQTLIDSTAIKVEDGDLEEKVSAKLYSVETTEISLA